MTCPWSQSPCGHLSTEERGGGFPLRVQDGVLVPGSCWGWRGEAEEPPGLGIQAPGHSWQWTDGQRHWCHPSACSASQTPVPSCSCLVAGAVTPYTNVSVWLRAGSLMALGWFGAPVGRGCSTHGSVCSTALRPGLRKRRAGAFRPALGPPGVNPATSRSHFGSELSHLVDRTTENHLSLVGPPAV